MSIQNAQLSHLSRLVGKHGIPDQEEEEALTIPEVKAQVENCRKLRISDAEILSAVRFGLIIAEARKEAG